MSKTAKENENTPVENTSVEGFTPAQLALLEQLLESQTAKMNAQFEAQIGKIKAAEITAITDNEPESLPSNVRVESAKVIQQGRKLLLEGGITIIFNKVITDNQNQIHTLKIGTYEVARIPFSILPKSFR